MDNATQMKKLFQDVAKVIGSLPADEGVLVFVYKDRKNRNPRKALEIALKKVDLNVEEDLRLPTGETRISIETWGNETSLNCYNYCQHVVLVGILHRDLTEFEPHHLGQINDLGRKVTTEEVNDISLSERVHLVYQALSRGSCRVIGPDFQAKKMTGYIVEYDPAIETELSKVMPGAVWNTWSPVHSNSVVHGQLISALTTKIDTMLKGLTLETVTIRSLKKSMGQSGMAFTTWQKALNKALEQNPQWNQHGQRLQRVC